MRKIPTITGVLFFTLISSIALVTSHASDLKTPLAWDLKKIPRISNQEIQMYFGDVVYVPNSDLNWSIDINPTELGSKYSYIKPWIYYTLPKCSEIYNDGCIQAVQYRVSSSTWLNAEVSNRTLPSKKGETRISGENTEGVISTSTVVEKGPDVLNHKPSAGKASYWTFENAPHGGGTEYLLRVNLAGAVVSDQTGRVQRYLEMGIFPVNDLTEYQFPEDIEIRVRLKLGVIARDLWGWFDGRVINPEVTLDTTSDEGIVEISGKPARIPIGATPKRLISDFKPEQLTFFTCDGRTVNICPSLSGARVISTSGNNELENFPRFEKLLGVVGTVGVSTAWWLKTTRWPNVATVQGCNADQNGFTGIVTTNASMYKNEAPVWNKDEKTFEFQVASPHLGLSGEINSGHYSLILPKSLAECRWGVDVTQAKATVSIISEDGKSKVSTATYKVDKNLLVFNISGFSYSAPKISIGLSSPQQLQKDAASSTVVKKLPVVKTLKCVKGTKLKVVISTSPRCPSGYKIKK
jgi:hypothetical protein